MNRREFLTRAVETGLALGLPSILLAACDESPPPDTPQNPNDYPHGSLPDIPVRLASNGDILGEGKYYPKGVLNANVEAEGLCNVWMAGEKLNPRQASGLPVNGETYAIATWRFNMGSKVTVTNIETGKSVVAVVTDRGPNEIAYPGHICDITPLVAREVANGKSYDIKIRLTPGEATSPPVSIQTVRPSENPPAPGTQDNNGGVCVSKFRPGETRIVGEPPHPGDNSRCVAGPNGQPTWVPNR